MMAHLCVFCVWTGGLDVCVHRAKAGETNILRTIHMARIINSYVCFASPWAQRTDFHRLQTGDLMYICHDDVAIRRPPVTRKVKSSETHFIF